MEELPVKAGINTVTNCIKGLENVISSQKSGEMAFFIKIRTNSHTMSFKNRDEMVKFN